jgi:hypothetical protein
MEVHLEPVTFIVRFYNDHDTYANKDTYVCVATITKCGSKGYIQGMHGELSREHYRLLFAEVAKEGIEFLFGDRNGLERVWNVAKMNSIFNTVSDGDTESIKKTA